MNILDKQAFIRQRAVESQTGEGNQRVYWSRHAIIEMVNDGLSRAQIEIALTQGEVIEDYPAGHRPLPDCLVLGRLTTGRPLHVVVAIDQANSRIFVVTIYKPAEERWKNDWRTRK